MSSSRPLTAEAYQLLTGDDEGRVCRDIPEAACSEQPGNFLKHVLSLTATKTGDGLADPKLVLSWLLATVGAPAWQVGLLVPVREAGALLPQLAISAWIRARPRRKWVWAGASAAQGLAVLGMAGAALTLDGGTAGLAVLGLLALFALARSFASVSYKDVLGKTVSKSTRGTATGAAASLASSLVLLFGVLVSLGVLPRTVGMVAGALLVAGALWIVAAGLFSSLAEEAGATGGGGSPLATAVEQIGLLRDHAQLRRFIVTRALLLSTALAPPWFLAVAGRTDGRRFGELGPFVVGSALAAVSSTWIWGRFADRSSRGVLTVASGVGAVALGVTAWVVQADLSVLESSWFLPLALFVLMVGYQGVRVGRSTHIVDMARAELRAAYVALSNTAIGLLLLAASAFGALAQSHGEGAVLGVFALLCLAAAFTSRGLEEVQKR